MQSLIDHKIQREFAHARKKREQPHDHRKGRNNKNKSVCRCSFCVGDTQGRRSALKQRVHGLAVDDRDPHIDSKDLTENEWNDVYKSLDAQAVPSIPHQVSLFDLVQPSRRRPEHTFEIIPRTKNVLVMDDGCEEESESSSNDDEWDHIEREEVGIRNKPVKPGPSYAEMAAKRDAPKRRAK